MTDLATPAPTGGLRHPPRGVARPPDHVIVIFGATGDLARCKLLPGLWHLAKTAMLPDGCRIVGTSEAALDSDEFRALARDAVDEHGTFTSADGDWDAFASRMTYVAGAFGPGRAGALARAVQRADADLGGARRLFFLAVPPAAFAAIVRGLGESGLANRARVLMIDVPETLSVDRRVGFYDATGAFRNMFVTHLFQLLGFVAMGPPMSMKASALARAKLAMLESLRELDPGEVVRGQYAGYEAPGSDTERLVALVAHIDNPRWEGVPCGDKTLFAGAARIERLWEVAAPLLASPPAVQTYPRGGWGPEPAIRELVAPRRWALPS